LDPHLHTMPAPARSLLATPAPGSSEILSQCQTTLNSAVAHNGTFVRFPSGTEVASFARFETTWPPSHCRRTLISSRYAVEHRGCGCALAIGECFCAR